MDLDESSADFKEGTPRQYALSAEFDVPKMIAAHGGTQSFVKDLDQFFFHSRVQTGTADMSGSFGAASIGNEPTMHTPYLYSAAGCLPKTQLVVDSLFKGLFSDESD